MTDKYSVKIRVWKQNNGSWLPQWYTCKNIVGGLSELVTSLEFDEDNFGYQYKYTETKLQFIKEDKLFLVKHLTGNNYNVGGADMQDRSFTAWYIPLIQIVDNESGNVFLSTSIDVNTLTINPKYIEVALIENSTMKDDMEKDISYSLQELDTAKLVKPIDVNNYQGNSITEDATLYGTAFLDDSWNTDKRLTWNGWKQKGSSNVLWCKPQQYVFVDGSSTNGIYANNEFWGKLGGWHKQEYIEQAQNSGYSVQKSLVGGYTIGMKKNSKVQVRMKISFYLKKYKNITINSYTAGYRPNTLSLYLVQYTPYHNGMNFNENRFQILIDTVQRKQDGDYDIYELNEKIYNLTLDWTFAGNLTEWQKHGCFMFQFNEELDDLAFYGQGIPITPKFDFGIVNNTDVSKKGYSFKCECIINGVANSIKDKRNDLYGIPIVDYARFIAQKCGVSCDFSQFDNEINNIYYSSENLVNYERRKQKDENYLELIEENSLKDVLEWLNSLFCTSMYTMKNGNNDTLIVRKRADFISDNVNGNNIVAVKPNRILEISPIMAQKTLNFGSTKYDLDFYSSNESINNEISVKFSSNNAGATKDIKCNICTDPQFIDWMLVAKDITGDKKFLVETDNGAILSWDARIIANITDGQYTGTSGYPTMDVWKQRNWTNLFLSHLAQYERWRPFLFTLPNQNEYKIVQNKTNCINIIDDTTPLFAYQKIYKDNSIGKPIWNNSNTVVSGIVGEKEPTQLKVRPKNADGLLLPVKIKVETPIYTKITNNQSDFLVSFDYVSGGQKRTIYGFPTEIKTYFGYKIQEIEMIVLAISQIDSINDIIDN